VRRRCLRATKGSVVGSPLSSRAQPAGIGFFHRDATDSLPMATVVVAMSSTKGAWRPAGAAKEMGLVLSFGARPKVGTMARYAEFVVESPIMSCSSAIIE
jgi:hypothetical protein